MKPELTLLTIAATLICLCAPATALAKGDSEPHTRLTQAQRTALLDARKVFQDQMVRLHAEMALAGNREDRIMGDKDISFQALRREAGKINALELEIEIAHIGAMEDIKGILAPDQWEDYLETISGPGPKSPVDPGEYEAEIIRGACCPVYDDREADHRWDAWALSPFAPLLTHGIGNPVPK